MVGHLVDPLVWVSRMFLGTYFTNIVVLATTVLFLNYCGVVLTCFPREQGYPCKSASPL